MKNLNIQSSCLFKVCLMLTMITALSCNNSNNDQFLIPAQSSESVNLALVKEVSSLPNAIISLGYTKLTNPEKNLFWQSHIDNYLNQHELSNEVRNHILLLKDFVSTDLYKNLHRPSTRKYIEEFSQKWYVEPLKNNTIDKEILLEVGTIFGTGTKTGPITNVDTDKQCECYYTLYCPSKESCIDGGCKAVYSCGIAGTSQCTGVCSI